MAGMMPDFRRRLNWYPVRRQAPSEGPMTRLSAIKQISVNARDLKRAIAFYRDTLGVRHLFDAPPQMSFFDCAGIRLLVGVAEKPEFDHASSILYFDVPDIKAAHADLKARGVKFRDEPHLAAKLPDPAT